MEGAPEGFLATYGGKNGILVERIYYQACKRSNETPLEYLYPIIVAAIRASPIRDGSSAIRKEPVNYYIGTLDDRDLSRMLKILLLEDADDLEETLKECENIDVRESYAPMKFKFFDSVLRHRRPICQRKRPGL